MHFQKTSLLAFALAAAPAIAQSTYTGPANLVFTMDNTIGINCLNTNEATIVGDDGVLTFSPGVDPFAYALCDYGTWAAFFGDVDGDGNYGEVGITSIDAICLPLTAAAPPSLFDCWLSIQSPIGPGGYLTAAIADGDIFRLTGTGIETLISQAQIITAANSTSTNVDTVGFAIDHATGDFYFTFTAGVDVNGVTLDDGGILRIPAAGYTLTGGLVSSVVPGSAEIVLTEAEVNAMFQNAGLNGITDCCGIEIDPTGGSFTSTATGKTLPHLWLCDDDNSDEGFVSTKTDAITGLPGVIPTVNGVALFGGNAFGLQNTDPFNGTLDNPFGIAFQFAFPSQPTPMHVDCYPIGQVAPTTFNLDLSGATPNGFVVYALGLTDASTVGGFTPRSPVAPIPLAGASWREFYPSLTGSAAILVAADGEGFGTFALNMTWPVPAGVGVIVQAGDISTFTVSAPLLVVTQ